MIAIIKTGGKQYSVKTGQILKVEKLEGNKGDTISLNNVLALSDSSNNSIGSPIIKDASVKAKIIDQIRNKKIIVFKKRRRKNYRSTRGHRQYLTVLKIESIIHGTKKTSVSLGAKKSSDKIKEELKESKVNSKKTIKKVAQKKKSVEVKSIKKTIKKKKATKKNKDN